MPINPRRFQVIGPVEAKASSVETATATGTAFAETNYSSTARVIEFHVIVAAASGTTPTLEVLAMTSLDGTNFAEANRSASITGTGTFSFTINRADHALGKAVRIDWVIGGTTPSFTFSVIMGKME